MVGDDGDDDDYDLSFLDQKTLVEGGIVSGCWTMMECCK